MSRIKKVRAFQILDSRSIPTIRVMVTTENGSVGIASVPSGASTGAHEALELRDGDNSRYFGKSVEKAIQNVEGPIEKAILGLDIENQSQIDARMIDADGTATKSKFGANAILGVSMAVARAAAAQSGMELYHYIYTLVEGTTRPKEIWSLPIPMLNVINGGAHADNTIDAQEFMIRPIGASSFSEAMRWSCETYGHIKRALKTKKLSTGVGDEGGFAPLLARDEEALDIMVEAIQAAGLQPGKDMTLALDLAASEFFEEGTYSDKKKINAGLPGTRRTSQQQIDFLEDWSQRYPIDSIEDGLSENDWSGFTELTKRLGNKVQIVGDDLLVTNPTFVREAIAKKAVSAVLIKLNQIGSVTETLETIRLSHTAGLKTIISHRSGETEDTFIADLAVAVSSGQIKTGAPCRSERVAKYNRLFEIEYALKSKVRYQK